MRYLRTVEDAAPLDHNHNEDMQKELKIWQCN
jgi:hypothetical protein